MIRLLTGFRGIFFAKRTMASPKRAVQSSKSNLGLSFLLASSGMAVFDPHIAKTLPLSKPQTQQSFIRA
jgi:hypothetical protein